MMAVTAVLVILALALLEQGGRVAVLLIVLGGIMAVAINRYVRAKFAAALAELAQRSGLTLVASPQHDLHRRLRNDIRWRWDQDTREWKFEGSFPYVAGVYRGHLVTVRVPSGVDFDWRGPESTRLAVHHKSKPTGFVVHWRAGVKALPPHRKLTPTGDPAFDRDYVIVGRDEEEIAAVLNPAGRQAVAGLVTTGIRGIELNQAGVSIYEPGRTCDVERMLKVLDALATLADNLIAYQRETAAR
jgi:hypothetical protein